MESLCVPSTVLDIVLNLTRLMVWEKSDDFILMGIPLQTELSVLGKNTVMSPSPG